MIDDYKDPLEAVANAQLEKTAANLQRLSHIEEEQATLDDIVTSLQQTRDDSRQYLAHDLTDIMALQARVLDAAFTNVVNNALNDPSGAASMETALKLQQQTVRTAMAWKMLKTDIYIQQKTLTFLSLEKKRIERTEQTGNPYAPLDR